MEKLNNEKELLKQMIAVTKIKASDNFKYRIMQQIETEKMLSVKSRKLKRGFSMNSMLSIFGVMYGLILLIGAGLYLNGTSEILESKAFYIPVSFVGFVCALFWVVTVLDDVRHSKFKGNKN